MKKRDLPYIKTVRARGNLYYYFNTGEIVDGKLLFKKLPAKTDKSFGGTYAAYLGHRNREKSNTLTVMKLVELYQASPKFEGLSAATQKIYRIYQGRLVQSLPTAPAGELDRKDVVKLFDKMTSKTPAAANMLISSVSALYRWGRRTGLVNNRPADDIDPNDMGEHEPWDDALLNKALTADDDTVRLAVHLLYYTSQRIGDVAAMRWSHIDDDGITITQRKTKKQLFIPLHPALAAELDRHTRDLRTILVNPAGKAFTTDNLRGVIKTWAAGHGHDVVPHGLRKNAVIALLEVGCSIAETAAISGQSLQMVEHYAKGRSQQKLARSAMKLWGGTESDSRKRLANNAGNNRND